MVDKNPVPGWFWAISGVALIWNLLGVMAYWAHVNMTPEDIAALEAAERALYDSAPAWATAAFAFAVFGGALGSVLLLMRKSWALPVFVISLLGVLAQMYHSFFMTNSIEVYGPGGMIMPVMVILIAAFLVWFSKSSKDKGWIG